VRQEPQEQKKALGSGGTSHKQESLRGGGNKLNYGSTLYLHHWSETERWKGNWTTQRTLDQRDALAAAQGDGGPVGGPVFTAGRTAKLRKGSWKKIALPKKWKRGTTISLNKRKKRRGGGGREGGKTISWLGPQTRRSVCPGKGDGGKEERLPLGGKD